MKHLHGWVFTYNHYTEKWYAATRDNYFDLFNGNIEPLLSSSSIETLKEIIIINKGSVNKILAWKKQQ